MKVVYNGRTYEFRACDTKNTTHEQLQELVSTVGYMQYEVGAAWLVVKGIGYGWEV